MVGDPHDRQKDIGIREKLHIHICAPMFTTHSKCLMDLQLLSVQIKFIAGTN